MIKGVCFAFLLTATAAAAAADDDKGSISIGSKVRVTFEDEAARRGTTLEGTLVRLEKEDLSVALPEGVPVVIERGAIRLVEVSRGRRSRRRGALIGAGVGAALGLAGTGLWSAACKEPDCRLGTGFGLLLYTPLAIGAGSLIGTALPPGQRWEAVSDHGARVQARPSSSRARDLGLSLSLSF